MRQYRLRCTGCGSAFHDDGILLDCPRAHAPALLRTEYQQRAFRPGDDPSIARYHAWLPLGGPIVADQRVAVYRSDHLAAALGLNNLWIAFSGWWPEHGASLVTGTFKELEAVAVLNRLAPGETRTLVLASAGNTAAAFARIATEREVPVIIAIPMDAWAALAARVRIGPTVRVVAVEDGTYDDAIRVARVLAAREGYFPEGGVRNVARRDGMGTVLLAAVEAMGALPAAYVQAVGSAAGALAAHEAALRVAADGLFGTRLPRLLLAQNAPFTPIHDAWLRRSEVLDERNPLVARDQIARLGAHVLANQAPPYAAAGGIRQALLESNGRTYAVENDAMEDALDLFQEREGIDIEPAAGVAIAALAQAVHNGDVAADETVLLHVTGGGIARLPRVADEQRPARVLRAAEIRLLT